MRMGRVLGLHLPALADTADGGGGEKDDHTEGDGNDGAEPQVLLLV